MRSFPDTIPKVVVFANSIPNGLPIARTNSPTFVSEESPSLKGVRFLLVNSRSAKSEYASEPITLAFTFSPLEKETSTLLPPSIT